MRGPDAARGASAFKGSQEEYERIWQMGHWPRQGVPPFDPLAQGMPADWNDYGGLWWGKKPKRRPWFQPKAGASLSESFGRMMQFLDMRPGPTGTAVTKSLSHPDDSPREPGPARTPLSQCFGADPGESQGWYRLDWMPFLRDGGRSGLPRQSPGENGTIDGVSDWQRAWHGCKLEALYSIMFHGSLLESSDSSRGERFALPGIYLHKDALNDRVLNYARFAPMFQDGVFWAAVWEVWVDRSDRTDRSRTPGNHWIQPERSVRLAALWLACCRYEDLPDGMLVSDCWLPAFEAHPRPVANLRPRVDAVASRSPPPRRSPSPPPRSPLPRPRSPRRHRSAAASDRSRGGMLATDA